VSPVDGLGNPGKEYGGEYGEGMGRRGAWSE
jgi:hypothetical protein